MSWNTMRPKRRDDRNKVKKAFRVARKEANKARASASGGKVASCVEASAKPSPLPRKRKNYGVNRDKEWAREMALMNCYYCGGPGGTIDHVVPLSKGGRTTLKNCVPACGWCNSKKGDKSAAEFMEWLRKHHFI